VGPAVQQASDIFDRFWNSRAVIPIRALHVGKNADAPEAVQLRLRPSRGARRRSGASPYLQKLTDTGQLQAHLDGACACTGVARCRWCRTRRKKPPPWPACSAASTGSCTACSLADAGARGSAADLAIFRARRRAQYPAGRQGRRRRQGQRADQLAGRHRRGPRACGLCALPRGAAGWRRRPV
jgi:hypothetical protein